MTRNWRLVTQRPRVEPSTLAKKEKIPNAVLLYLKRQLIGVDADTYSQTLGHEGAQVGVSIGSLPRNPIEEGKEKLWNPDRSSILEEHINT